MTSVHERRVELKKEQVLAGNVAGWLLKCNPEVWDPRAAISAGEPIDGWRLANSYRADVLQPGDRVFLWVTGQETSSLVPGLWAEGEITGYAYDGEGGGGAWRDLAERKKTRPYVGVRMDLVDPPISRADLQADDRFERCEILIQPQMGNPLALTDGEVTVLEEAISDTR